MDIQNTVNNGQFQPGHEKIPGSGRKPGTPNKYSGQIKDALTGAIIELMPEMVERMRQTTTARDVNGNSFMGQFFSLLNIALPHDGERVLIPIEHETDDIRK